SVLEIGQGVFEVLSSSGDTFLGGEDFDERIMEWLVEGFAQEHGIDLRTDRMALQRLRDAAEKAKVELSAAHEVDINLPFIYSPPPNKGAAAVPALHLQRQLTREKLNHLVQDLVMRTAEICRQAMQRATVNRTDIAAVILVGGMTR